MTAPTGTLTQQDRDTAMIMRLWDLGLDLDAIAAAAGLTTHRAAGLVHTQLCALTGPAQAAQDARLAPWWGLLRLAARDVARGLRTPADVASEYGVETVLVRQLATRAKRTMATRRHRSTATRGPSLRDMAKAKLLTAWQYGHTATEAAKLSGVKIVPARRYLTRIAAMTPAQRHDEAERVGAYRWTLAGGVWYEREENTDA